MEKRSGLNRAISAILTAVLIVELIAVFAVSVLKYTIGSKEYIIATLDKVNYYQTTKNEIEDAFKYYVLQSNLDDECVEDIITVEKVKKDTLIVLNKFYDGSKENFEVDSIKEELNKRINEKVENEYNNIVTEDEKKDIEKLVDIIVDNYSNNMETVESCFNATAKIAKVANRIQDKYVKLAYGVTIVTIVLLSVLYISGTKNKKIIFNKYHAIAFMTVGFILIIGSIVLLVFVKEDQIQIFTKGITAVIVEIIKNIKSIIAITGGSLFGAGLLMAIVKSILLRKYIR